GGLSMPARGAARVLPPMPSAAASLICVIFLLARSPCLTVAAPLRDLSISASVPPSSGASLPEWRRGLRMHTDSSDRRVLLPPRPDGPPKSPLSLAAGKEPVRVDAADG